MSVNRRLKIIWYPIVSRCTRGGLLAWIWNVLSPPSSVLRVVLCKKVNEDSANFSITIRGQTGALCLPRECQVGMFDMVVAEQCFRLNWHNYLFGGWRLSSADVVLDCGAAEGIFPFVTKNTGARYYLFEPSRLYASALRQTFRDVTRFEVVECALSDTKGLGVFEESGVESRIITGSSVPLNGSKSYSVNIVTVDEFCRDRCLKPTFIKADMEGFEVNMLRGATYVLEQYKPRIAVTTYHSSGELAEIKRILMGANPSYRIRTIGFESWRGGPMLLQAW